MLHLHSLKRPFSRLLVAGAAVGLGFLAAGASQAQDQVAAGLSVWKDRGGCFNCHGTFGEGGEGGHFPAGPSLRRSLLDPDSMREFISCGVPGTQMPFNLEGAYTEHSCFGGDLGPVPADVSPGAALSSEEIDSLMAYLQDRVVGKRRVTRDECVAYFADENAPECASYR
jgi:mono/diheme cytochrome c family protein